MSPGREKANKMLLRKWRSGGSVISEYFEKKISNGRSNSKKSELWKELSFSKKVGKYVNY